jgi:hypothetical protein
MPEKAWAYYSSAADDEITIRENHAAFHRSDIQGLRCQCEQTINLLSEYGFGLGFFEMLPVSITPPRSLGRLQVCLYTL